MKQLPVYTDEIKDEEETTERTVTVHRAEGPYRAILYKSLVCGLHTHKCHISLTISRQPCSTAQYMWHLDSTDMSDSDKNAAQLEAQHKLGRHRCAGLYNINNCRKAVAGCVNVQHT